MNKKNSILLLDLTQGAMIAALYVVLTFIANLAGLASGVIQVRLSEALTILPVFTAAAVPGLAVGCVLANLLTGCAIWDVVFGSLATLIGAVGTRLLHKKVRYWRFCRRSSQTSSSYRWCCSGSMEWRTLTGIWR